MNDNHFGSSVFTVRESEEATHPNGLGVLVDLFPKLGVRALIFSNYVLPLTNPSALYAAVFDFRLHAGNATHILLQEADVEHTQTSPDDELGTLF